LMGLIGFLPTKANGAIGGVDFTPEERRKIAQSSREYTCPVCKIKNIELLPDAEAGASTTTSKEEPVILSFGYQKDQNEATPQNTSTSNTPRPATPAVVPPPPTVPVSVTAQPVQPSPTRTIVAPPQPPSPWLDRALAACVALLAVMILRKFA